MNQKRFEYLDVAKGIGIICVVMAHAGILTRYLYLFHMPLFFFISGFLYKPAVSQKEFFKKKITNLLIPYLLFLILLFPIQTYEMYHGKSLGLHESEIIGLRFILGGRWLASIITVFWFITCLFSLQVLYNYLIIKFRISIIHIIVVFMLIVSYINAAFFPYLRVPWDVNAVLFIISFYHIGYMYKSAKTSIYLITACVILSIAGMVLVYLNSNSTLDIKNCKYGIPFISLLCSLGVVVTVFELSKRIATQNYASDLLIKIGKGSLIIMYLHQLFNFLFQSFNPFITCTFSIACCYLCYLLLSKFSSTRFLFLGTK